MARTLSFLTGALTAATLTIAALPAAQGLGITSRDAQPQASTQAPVIQVNRGAKGDRFVQQQSIAVKKAPTEAAREGAKLPASEKRRIMDGCEPSFSPVTMPSMAHISGRCVS